jgi:hypothetical protein
MSDYEGPHTKLTVEELGKWMNIANQNALERESWAARYDKLHIALCQACEYLNQGHSASAHKIIRVALYDEAQVAEKAEAALSPTPKLEVLHLEIDRETDGRWIAEWTHSPGVMAYGKTKQEAIECATKLLAEADLALSKTPAEPKHLTDKEWDTVHELLEPWQKVWAGDRDKFAADYPLWILDAAAELFAHDMCDVWVWNEYVKAAAVIIARHFKPELVERAPKK